MVRIPGWSRDKTLSRSYKYAWKSDSGSSLIVTTNNVGSPVVILQRPPIRRNDGGWEYVASFSITRGSLDSFEDARKAAVDYMKRNPNG